MDAVLQEPLMTLAVRVFLALLLATAALSKLTRIEEFYGVVRNFRLLPDGVSRAVAMVLPVVELAVAVGLVIGPLAVPAATAAAVLFAVFGVAIAINVLRGRTSIDCGCFRQGLKQGISWLLVGRNVVLTALAAATAYLLPSVPAAGGPDIFVGIAAGVLAILLYFSASLLGGIAAAQKSTLSSKGR